MPYRSYRLPDIYKCILENDQEGLNTSRWLSLSPAMLQDNLQRLKQSNPSAYGSTLVKLYANPQTRRNLLAIMA